ncbi:hypothetical protein PGT21_009557 [Puccinia graminis f. sp. tritici]|uniref:Uncharacterized protein n=1 Tax=Puccinia graminis f. sp. tritici TaxID=56615 RepID=A0A5B0PTW9_PUCGR|nr:hypothetical protein PGT21_009557 [Puccinia graminis f. sp. tritici]
MRAGKDSTRGMMTILFIGMITTLSMNLANAMLCTEAFQTKEGGWGAPPGKAGKPYNHISFQILILVLTVDKVSHITISMPESSSNGQRLNVF